MSVFLLAVVLSLLIGLSLGLLGGGGSILSVPILVYALGVDEKSAIASSLVVVGSTAAVAAWGHARRGNVVWRAAVVFAGAGAAGALVGGNVAHFIPAPALLALFSIVMAVAGIFMWRGRAAGPSGADAAPASPALLPLIAQGVAIGVITGLVGAGGGFLLVPALTLWARLPLPQAVGTSLTVIAINSAAGFVGTLGHVDVPWGLTAVVTVSAIVGSFVGARLSAHVPQTALRKGFAVFVLAMALVMGVVQARALLALQDLASHGQPQ